jgi:5'-methylthioadenosine phosphorylase
MSALPEAKLAREAEIAYQMICMSTDYDCWRESDEPVTVEMVMGHMKANAVNARHFVGAVLDELCKQDHSDTVMGKHWEGWTIASISTAPQGRNPEVTEKLHFLFPEHF